MITAPATASLSPAPTLLPASPTAPVETPSSAAPLWWVAADATVPEPVRARAQALVAADDRFGWQEGAAVADVRLTVGRGQPIAHWVYALAAPFATVRDDVGWAELTTDPGLLGQLFLDPETARVWTGLPATVTALPDVVGAVWVYRPAWTLVPFDGLRPEYKVLTVDGRSPLASGFEPSDYPLTVMIGTEGVAKGVEVFLALWGDVWTNRDPALLTTVSLSGVSAPARSVGWVMQTSGVRTPGENVAPVLSAADVAHVSNEIPLTPNCPLSEQQPVGDAVFCAPEGHLELFTSLGVDIVEVTGNHVNDWGEPGFQHTLNLYEAAGLRWFGGGRDLMEAEAPLRLEHNGNRLAFVGCNAVGPYGAWARPGYGGSRPCGDYAGIRDQIAALRSEGYLVLATLQYQEYYFYAPAEAQRRDFRTLVQAGAAAVSGSQGHHAQGFDFLDGGFIHYGLGNLFFDQMDMPGTRQTFIDTYVVYDNRLLSVALWTGLIESYCCPRQMTTVERADLLRTVFAASGW
jgi:poly-gamma-glutamate synthesis protein (capsule biosynthesis protein)